MFVDEISVSLSAWKWWDWVATFRREKYIPKWGPWGWDWWKWWDVYIVTNENLNTLSKYRNHKELKAKNWEHWATNCMHWADWENLIIEVPVWTLVKNEETWDLIADLDKKNIKFLLYKWWRWWYWNAHFTSSTRQAPRFAEIWDIPEKWEIRLELKLTADIWIIWVPSAWKSSLISNLTNVKPKIWDYPFTTLVPNLWVLEHKWKSLVLEDVPGLIPWASQWKWLWIEFLKHIERTKVLLHLLDVSRLDNIFQDYEDIRKELRLFSDDLDEKEEIIGLSKADLLDDEMLDFILKEFQNKYPDKKVFVISSASRKWVPELSDYLINFAREEITEEAEEENEIEELTVFDLRESVNPRAVEVEYLWNYLFRAKWERLEQIVRMTNFDNFEAIMRVYDVMDKMWVIKKVERELSKILKNNDWAKLSFFEESEDPRDFVEDDLDNKNEDSNIIDKSNESNDFDEFDEELIDENRFLEVEIWEESGDYDILEDDDEWETFNHNYEDNNLDSENKNQDYKVDEKHNEEEDNFDDLREEEEFMPRIMIWEKTIDLEKLRFKI